MLKWYASIRMVVEPRAYVEIEARQFLRKKAITRKRKGAAKPFNVIY